MNDINIISFSAPGRISRAVESTNSTTIVFTLPHIMAPKFASQLPIKKRRAHVQRQRECLKLGIAVSMHGNTGERIIRFDAKVQAVHIYIYIHVIDFYSMEMFSVQIYVETTKKNVELWKPTHQTFGFADLRFRVFTCRNCYANAADDMKKSDLKRKSKIAAVIMKWLSQGIPFTCGYL